MFFLCLTRNLFLYLLFSSDDFSCSCFNKLALGKPQAIIYEEVAEEIEADQSKEEPRLRRPKSKKDSFSQSLTSSDGNNLSKKQNNVDNFTSVM